MIEMPEKKLLLTYTTDDCALIYHLDFKNGEIPVFETREEVLLGFANYLFESKPDIYSKYSKEDWEQRLCHAKIIDIRPIFDMISDDISDLQKLQSKARDIFRQYH